MSGLAPLAAQAQTPYNFSTSGNIYTENFTGIAAWDNLAAGATQVRFADLVTPAGQDLNASRFARLPTNGANLLTPTDADAPNVTTNLVFAAAGGGGVQKFTTVLVGVTQPAIALLATGTTPVARSTGFDLFLDFTSRNAGTLTFNFAQLTNAAGAPPRTGALRVYASVNGTNFSQLGTTITVTNGVASNGSFSRALPAFFNGSSSARLRFYYTSALDASGGGSRPGIVIDDIVATATAVGGAAYLNGSNAPVALPSTISGTASAGRLVGYGGGNLTGSFTASVGAPFEVATALAGPYSASVGVTVAGGNPTTTLFVHTGTTTAGNYTSTINYSAASGVGAPVGTPVSGTVSTTEPTAQPTVTLSNPTFNTLDVVLSPAVNTGGTGQKYLVVARPAPDFTTQMPVDGVTYTPNLQYGGPGASTVGTVVTFVVSASAATSFTITGLASNTQYFVAAFSYNDDNVAGAENYLISGFPLTAPSNNNRSNATTLSPPPNIYLWTGPANGSYTTAANWTSQVGSAIGAGQPRTTPLPEDILTFGAGTSTVLVDLLANQQIGGLLLNAASTVTLTLDGLTDRTITLAGTVAAGDDFVVPSGATLNVRNNTTGGGLKLTLITPTTGLIGGTLDLNGATAVLTSDPALSVSGVVSAVQVTSGGSVVVGANATGATIVGGTALIFRNGSSLTQNGGNSPTAAFEPTSTFTWNQNAQLSFSNRTYGNLVFLNHANASATGGTLTINNLTFSALAKTLSFDLTGGVTINGNINITAGTVNFQPASATSLTLNPAATFTSVSPVTFSNVTLNRPGATLTLNDVIVGAAALTLGTTTDLNIARRLTFLTAAGITAGGNTLKLLSTLAQTAYVVNTGAGTGTATVQRAVDGLTGINGLGYRHYSAPVSGATVNMLGSGTTPAVFNTAYNLAANPTDGSVVPYPNVFAYDATRVITNDNAGFVRGYISPASGDPMTVGKGFSMRKDRSTVEMTGTLVTGTQNLPMTGNGTPGAFHGWNLLGNTYPSALDWSLVSVPANVGVVAYAIRPTTATGGIYVQYANVPAAANREMPMAQGFFLRKINGAVTTVPLTNAARVTTSDGNRAFNRSAQPVDLMPALHMTLGQPGDVARPEAEVYFDATATNGLENLDGVVPGRSFGDAPTLLMLVNGTEVSVNRLAAFTGAEVVVPMLVATPLAGQYKLDVRTLANFPAGTQVLLEDAMTGRTTDLALNPSVNFYSDANYAGQRFTLRFTTGRVTGLSTDLGAAALSLFPNPAAGSVRVSAPAGATVRVFDALGRVVRTVRIDAAGSELTLGLNGLTAGFYTVRAGAASQKLVVE